MMRPGTENSGITQNMHNKRSGHHTSKATPTFCILLSTAAICIISYSFDNQPFNPTVKCCSKNTCNPKHSYVTLLFSEVGKWLSLQLMDASVSHTFSNIITWCLNFKQTVEHFLSDTTTHVFKCQVKRSRYWIKVSLYLTPFWTMYWIKCPLFVTGMVVSLCSLSVQTHITVRVYSRARLWGISAIWKKCRVKFTLPRQMGCKKYRPKDKYNFFGNKVFENVSDNNTDLTAAHTINLLWIFIASYCLNCLSLLRLSHYFTQQTSGILQQFEPSIFQLCRMFQNGGKASLSPFLKKGPPKITEGGPFDPHWPISRINPELTCHRKMFFPVWWVTDPF